MSLEQAMNDLTDAVRAQTALMEKMSSGKAVSAAKDAPKDDDPAPAAPAKRRGRPPKITVESVGKEYGEFLAKATNKTDRNKLVAEKVKPILEHLGAARISEIDPSRAEEAQRLLEPLKAALDEGGVDAALEVTLPFMEDDGGDAEDDGDEEDII